MWSQSRHRDGRWSAVTSTPLTNAGRRRVSDHRLGLYRAFAEEHGWRVLGLHQDLSRRYPVDPLLGALSAQAELALTDQWDGWTAIVASVRVRPGAVPRERRARGSVVQLTTLETGPLGLQFAAAFDGRGFNVVPLTRTTAADEDRIRRLLKGAAGQERLQRGDQVAADEVELVHARELHARRHQVDVEGPLIALSGMATRLVL